MWLVRVTILRREAENSRGLVWADIQAQRTDDSPDDNILTVTDFVKFNLKEKFINKAFNERMYICVLLPFPSLR